MPAYVWTPAPTTTQVALTSTPRANERLNERAAAAATTPASSATPTTIVFQTVNSIIGILPLTTIFTPPSSCFKSAGLFFYEDYINDSVTLSVAPALETSCYPSINQYTYDPLTTFSPGICPSGYSVVNSVVLTPATRSSSPVTYNTCCPPSFSLNTYSGVDGWEYNCWSALNGGSSPTKITTTLTVTDVYTVTWNSELDQSDTSKFSDASTYLFSTDRVVAFPIAVAYESTDTQILSLMQSVSTNWTSQNGTAATMPAHKSLSSGALAGIIVGPIIFLILLCTVMVRFLSWRRNRWQKSKTFQGDKKSRTESQYQPIAQYQSNAPCQAPYEHQTQSEMISQSHSELGDRDLGELDGTSIRNIVHPQAGFESNNLHRESMNAFNTPESGDYGPIAAISSSDCAPSGPSIQSQVLPQRIDAASPAPTSSSRSSIQRDLMKIREEKARLKRLQELEEREERLQSQMSAED